MSEDRKYIDTDEGKEDVNYVVVYTEEGSEEQEVVLELDDDTSDTDEKKGEDK